jgi:hypothetical protein
MAIVHTAYAMIKMPGLKGIIILKSDQHNTLACENAALTYIGRFGEKEAHELTAKMAKTHRGSTPARSVVPKPPISGTTWPPAKKKGVLVGSTSTQ